MTFFEKPLIHFCEHMVRCFEQYSGRPLLENSAKGEALVQELYSSSAIIVAHGNQQDPVFCFANQSAQDLWGLSWEQFTSMPSKESAPPEQRVARQKLLDAASGNNIVTNYHGIRISSTGQKIEIQDVILWNVLDENGKFLGQAATFDKVRYLEKDREEAGRLTGDELRSRDSGLSQ